MSIAFKVPNITETATLFFTSMGTSSGETEEHWKQNSLDHFRAKKWSRDIPVGRWNATYSIGMFHRGENK